MGFLGHYRQFEGMSEQEVNARLREGAQERRRRVLARRDPLDLSRTTWPEYPPPAVVNAITYAARRGLHRSPDRHAGALRADLARRLAVDERRVVVGAGAAQLMGFAAHALLERGDELVTPWPSYGLYPVLARRAGARAVPVAGFAPAAILAAVNERTRLVALCNPNDPTGELFAVAALRALLERLPERVVVLLDEALRDFVDAEPRDAALALIDEHPRLLVFRTFSKAWGLAGLRCGYAIGGPGAAEMLAGLEPELGIDELAQAGALAALRSGAAVVDTRAGTIAEHRRRLAAALASLPFDAPPSQANVVWLARVGGTSNTGAPLAGRLERAGIIVHPGGPLGDAQRVRISIPHRVEYLERLVGALESAADG